MGIYGMLFRLISILEWDPTWDPIRGFSNGDFGIAATRISGQAPSHWGELMVHIP